MAKRGRKPKNPSKLKVEPPEDPGEMVEPIQPSSEEIPTITSTPTEAQKIKIAPEKVLNFRILKLREQIIALKEENLNLLRQRTEVQKENLQLRKDLLNKEQEIFLKDAGLAPGDKIIPDPEGDGYHIHRALLEKFSVGLESGDKPSGK